MNLIIDIGNTRVKTVVFDKNNEIVGRKVNNNDLIIKDIEDLLANFNIKNAIVSQVGSDVLGLSELLQKHKIKLVKLDANLILPFKIVYKTPQSIGADRLALVAGAQLCQPDTNKLIIDAGTCITYDFIDKNNVYHGGAISPGLFLRYKSLHDYTANLPLLSPENKNTALIGFDTKSSIQSGVVLGFANEVSGFIVKYNLKFKDLTVFLTGGDKKILDSYIKNMIFANSNSLLLKGLNYILNLNL